MEGPHSFSQLHHVHLYGWTILHLTGTLMMDIGFFPKLLLFLKGCINELLHIISHNMKDKFQGWHFSIFSEQYMNLKFCNFCSSF